MPNAKPISIVSPVTKVMTHNVYHGLLGLVLCGGRATRMGGQDKGLIPFNNQPMAAYAVAAFQACEQIIINANRNHIAYQQQFQLPIISDSTENFDGPLAGMLAGLQYAEQHSFEWVISAPCDAPFITDAYVARMWQAARSANQPILMAADSFRQPVFALLHVSITPALTQFLHGSQKKILLFYEQVGYETVQFADSRYFENINSPTDLH